MRRNRFYVGLVIALALLATLSWVILQSLGPNKSTVRRRSPPTTERAPAAAPEFATPGEMQVRLGSVAEMLPASTEGPPWDWAPEHRREIIAELRTFSVWATMPVHRAADGSYGFSADARPTLHTHRETDTDLQRTKAVEVEATHTVDIIAPDRAEFVVQLIWEAEPGQGIPTASKRLGLIQVEGQGLEYAWLTEARMWARPPGGHSEADAVEVGRPPEP